MFRRGGPIAGRGGPSGGGNSSDEERKGKRRVPADPARKAVAASDGARKRGARAWTNRGMRPPPAYERRELPEYDRRMAMAMAMTGSSSGAGCSSIARSRTPPPPPKREEEEQQERPPRSGRPLLPGDFVSEEDLPWVTLEVFQRSTEEEKRRQMEIELDQRRLEVGIYSSLHDVIDISSDSDGAGLFDSDED